MFSKGLDEQMKITTQHTLRENWKGKLAHNIAQLDLVFTSNSWSDCLANSETTIFTGKVMESTILLEIFQTSTKSRSYNAKL